MRREPPYTPEPGESRGFFGAPRGPLVLPGDYTVRLAVGADTLTRTATVRLDPRVPDGRADLAARDRALRSLYALAGPAHTARTSLQKAVDRVGAVKELLKKRPDGDGAAAGLKERADSLGKRLEDLRSDVAKATRASRLSFAIEGAASAPTADQQWQVQQAWKDARTAVDALNPLLTGDLPKLEADVYQAAAAPAPIPPVELPQPPSPGSP